MTTISHTWDESKYQPTPALAECELVSTTAWSRWTACIGTSAALVVGFASLLIGLALVIS